mgnify:CR=1 FL=1
MKLLEENRELKKENITLKEENKKIKQNNVLLEKIKKLEKIKEEKPEAHISYAKDFDEVTAALDAKKAALGDAELDAIIRADIQKWAALLKALPPK